MPFLPYPTGQDRLSGPRRPRPRPRSRPRSRPRPQPRPRPRLRPRPRPRPREGVQHPVSSSAPGGEAPLQSQHAGQHEQSARPVVQGAGGETTPRFLPIERPPKQGQHAWKGCLSGPVAHRAKPTSFAGPVLLPKATALIKFKLLILKERKGRITSQVRFIELLEVVCPLLWFFSPKREGQLALNFQEILFT